MAAAPTNLDALTKSIIDGVMGQVGPKLEEVSGKMTGLEEKVTAIETKQASRVKRANPNVAAAEAVPGAVVLATAKIVVPKEFRGIRFARALRALSLCGEPAKVPDTIRNQYGDEETANLIERGFQRVGKTVQQSTPSSGGFLVLEDMITTDFIEFLRDRWSVLMAGARLIAMDKGNLHVAGMESGTSFQWVGETEQVTDSTPGFESVDLAAKMARAFCKISNSLREQASYDVDRIVLDDMADAVTEGLAFAALVSPGGKKSPRGIKYNERRTQVAIGAITSDSPSKFRLAIKKKKVNFSKADMAHVFAPEVEDFLYNLKTNIGTYHFREEMDNGLLMGSPYHTSTQIAVSDANITDWFYGKWREFWVAITKMMEIKVDPFTGLGENCTYAYLFHETDFALRQGAAMGHAGDVDVS